MRYVQDLFLVQLTSFVYDLKIINMVSDEDSWINTLMALKFDKVEC